MYINDHIETLHDMLKSAAKTDIVGFAVYRRMFALGVVSYLNEVNRELEDLNKRMDSDIEMEAFEIKYDTYLETSYWMKTGWFGNSDKLVRYLSGVGPYDVEDPYEEINTLVDYFPNKVMVKEIEKGEKRELFTQGQIETFKNSMYQLCDKDKMDARVINYSLTRGLNKMLDLLINIKKKTQNPQDHHFLKLWENTMGIYKQEELDAEYKDWKDDYDVISYDKFKEKQMQEVMRFLMSGFLRFRPTPTHGDINRCKIAIPEEAMEVEGEVPRNLQEQCARLEYIAHWADKDGSILLIDYRNLGKYLFKNKDHLTDEDKYAIARLDQMLDLIHEDMAEKNIQLKPYLKRYEEDKINSLLNDCAAILNSCQQHLKDDIRNTYLREFLSMMLFDDEIKLEAREKLSGTRTRNKYLCHIIAALDCFYVFKPTIVKEDLARSLSEKFESTNYESTLENIERFQRKKEGALYEWTKKKADDLKANPYNPFKGLI